jgi:hypothetical protein
MPPVVLAPVVHEHGTVIAQVLHELASLHVSE